MAVLNRNNLVLRGVSRDVVSVQRFAVSPASAGTPALSYPRHLSTGTPSTEPDSRPRHAPACSGKVGCPARRAGRPGGPAGVPERLARIAGRTIQFGWPQGQSQASLRRTKPAGSLTRLPRLTWSGKRCEVIPPALPPALRMPRA
jgi:hypothetical protein